MNSTYETIVGMEIHVELKTNSKMFCGCKNDPFHAPKPNIHTCPVCLGLPGALPVPNRQAVEWTIMLGLALGCEIPELSKFDRKNYFYPDLAKGYQISQYDQPLCIHGLVKTELGDVRIHRVHLEEDTGKLMHTTVDGNKVTLIDFNRSGVPLVEIVTEPDIRSGDQAKAFLKKLQQIIRYVGISDADMEKGSMRLEPNISVRKKEIGEKSDTGEKREQELPKYKVEVKNINSFNFVKKAIEFETERHIKILEKGETPVQETRGWKETPGITVTQRIKETADDYRYFPEPDIPPMRWTKPFIESLKNKLPELPDDRKARFMVTYNLSDYDAGILTETPEKAAFFEAAAEKAQKLKATDLTPKKIANVIINKKTDTGAVNPEAFVRELAAATQAPTVTEEELESAVKAVIAENPKAVTDYKAGREQVMMFLVGLTFRKLGKKTDAGVIIGKLKTFIS